MTKTCSICLEEKGEADFAMNRSNTRDGLSSHCRSCQKVKNAALKVDPLIRSRMLEIAAVHPRWDDGRVAESLAVHGLTGRLSDRRSRANNIIIIIDDAVINGVAIPGGEIRSDNLHIGYLPGVIAVIGQVQRAIEVWGGAYEFVDHQRRGRQLYLQFKNGDGEARWAQAGDWIRGKDAFADGCSKLSLRELHNGKSSWTYAVRLCYFEIEGEATIKLGKGRKGLAMKEHQGCEIHQIGMSTGWHARVAEAMIHVELMQYHSPLPKGSLPKGGESEVFRINDMMIAHEAIDRICAEVNSWSIAECERRHDDMSRLCSSTSGRMHARQQRLHPTPLDSTP